MELNNIKPADGAKHAKRRVGRGIGSGLGKTAGRGHKGQKSRAGGYHKVGFEGGQMPLQRRLPKRGFRPLVRTRYALVKVGQLERFESGAVVGAAELAAAGLVRAGRPVKLLADGMLSKKLTVKVDKASAAARAAITAAGGVVETAAETPPATQEG